MAMKEKWEPIKNTNGKYFVSNLGNIKNKRNQYISLRWEDNQRLRCKLDLYGTKKMITVARIVAEHFIINPYKKECVGFLDGNQRNCKVLNLFWCSRKELQKYYKINKLNIYKNYVEPVIQYDLNGKELRRFKSALIAARSIKKIKNSSFSHIKQVCEGFRKTCGGYIWKYEKDVDNKINIVRNSKKMLFKK